jgi:hypothetical protein
MGRIELANSRQSARAFSPLMDIASCHQNLGISYADFIIIVVVGGRG